MKGAATVIVLLFVSSTITGCLGNESIKNTVEASILNDICPDGMANNTWYHFSNSTNIITMEASELSSILVGENIPICAKGT